LGYADQQAITVSFLTLAFGKLWFVLNLRDHDAKRFDNDIVRNGWLWAATGLCIVILLAAVYLPGLSEVLQTMAPDPSGWALILALSLAPAVIGLSAPGIRFHRASETSPEQEAAANRDSGNVSSSAA
jgi:Ca2+-transporting ATPase